VTNYWFDPVVPSTLIELEDMCAAYQELFIGLDEQEAELNVTYDTDDIIIYSYTLNYYMYINGQ